MRGFTPRTAASRTAGAKLRRACLLGLILNCSLGLHSQIPGTKEPPGSASAFSREKPDSPGSALVQMPVLVLTPSLRAVPALTPARFSLSIDKGKPFAPAAARPEGSDPIAAAVLLDEAGEERLPLPELTAALVHLRTVDLHPQDSLSLFAVDCKTVRYSGPVPRDARGVEQALEVVLSLPDLHAGRGEGACKSAPRLWDTTVAIVNTLADQPARRVLLAFTVGHDRGSRVSWSFVRSHAALRSVSVFAFPVAADGVSLTYGTGTGIENVCELTGGLLLAAERPKQLAAQVENAISLTRSRYILEFAKPVHLGTGPHSIHVELPNTRAVILTTGMSEPLPAQNSP